MLAFSIYLTTEVTYTYIDIEIDIDILVSILNRTEYGLQLFDAMLLKKVQFMSNFRSELFVTNITNNWNIGGSHIGFFQDCYDLVGRIVDTHLLVGNTSLRTLVIL